jgi:hypothetical protein
MSDAIPVSNSTIEDPASKKDRFRPTKTLPTDRITFDNQLKILRAWAAAGMSGKPVTNDDVAAAVGMKGSTIALANPFFSSIGLLLRGENGYTPGQAVLDFFRATEWDETTAARKLAPALREQWFADAILPTLAVNGILSEEVAVSRLADAASAAKEYKNQLGILIDYMNASGLLIHEGDQIKKGPLTTLRVASQANIPIESEHKPVTEKAKETGHISTQFQAGPAGGVSFDIRMNVDMAEFATWKPERITAFFNGIAAVLAAKSGVEKGSAGV